MKETSIESKFVKFVENEHGVLCPKFQPVGRKAWPDRILLSSGARCSFVEMKVPDEPLRKLQQWRKKQLEALGFIVEVVDRKDYEKWQRIVEQHKKIRK